MQSSVGHAPPSGVRALGISLAALGVVYGDIGTSPIYAFKACFDASGGALPRTEANVLGILSLIFWSLTLVVAVKYLTFVLRADNRGEGGVLAMLALLGKTGLGRTRRVVPLALFGAALLYGDGMITPAVTVLGAVEGISVATHALDAWVVPITCALLIALFMAQRQGTARVGAVFGPVMLVWFLTLVLIALPWIARRPTVLLAIDPLHAVRFFLHHKLAGFLILGTVVLCITGGEALYADMGHFGKGPIRNAWYCVVFPALMLNYFGQGALLLERGDAVQHSFYELVAPGLLYPLVVLATVSAVVASQALISGAFSLTRQAVQLGYLPRVTIVHTSDEAEGQIYVPAVNTLLMVACVALVVTFREASKLAAAYGIAVTGTMAITSVLFYVVAVERWHWPRRRVFALVTAFLAVDLAFLLANALKIAHGGWVPVVIAVVVFVVMVTWKRGRSALAAHMQRQAVPLDAFLAEVAREEPTRVAGTAVFMTSSPDGAPPVLLHHFKHNKTLHERVVLLSVLTTADPHERRVAVRDLGAGFSQMVVHCGFMETPDVPTLLSASDDVSYFLGRETLLTTGSAGMAWWRKALFAFLSRNARPATAFFALPPNRVIELGIQVEL